MKHKGRPATCAHCGIDFMQHSAGRLRNWCASPCRLALAAERAQAKRAAGYVSPSRLTACMDCGTVRESRGLRCDPCYRADMKARAAAAREPGQTKRMLIEKRRMERDAAASGPWNEWARLEVLLPRWQMQGRLCTYCDDPATTVDHVIPLALGGTNYEGNLVPACNPCNRAKSSQLIAQWRYRTRVKRLPQFATGRQVRKPRKTYRVECALCATAFTASSSHAKYCGDDCRIEKQARAMRDKYRAANGLPVDPSAPTRNFGRRAA